MSENTLKLDEIDKKILKILCENSKINNLALAELVNLSPTPCARRVKILEEAGIIKNYSAKLSREKLGKSLTAFVAITLDRHSEERFKTFEAAVMSFPEVIRMSIITGRSEDYLLEVCVSDMEEYRDFLLSRLNRIEGVVNVHSSFELNRVIDREIF